MHTVPISDAKAKLNEYVEQAQATHEHLTITKNGLPAAVMIAADEWESIQETLFWLSQPGVREDVATGVAEHAAGETLSEEQVRAMFGASKRS